MCETPPQMVVHDRAQALAVLNAAAELGRMVRLRSATDAAAYAGVGYLKALGDAVGHEIDIDCGDECWAGDGGAADRLPQACVLRAGGAIWAAGGHGGAGRCLVPSRGAGAPLLDLHRETMRGLEAARGCSAGMVAWHRRGRSDGLSAHGQSQGDPVLVRGPSPGIKGSLARFLIMAAWPAPASW